ncbi:hypothetical protein ROZALSC1DRAFT_27362 [Rozella allomycis CSF55]|uniref:Uncharacterized protein n=1 Tax=Rozella allomycis (strain CSF55) TaxID=988480 RepID=A0A075B1A5_ROZAC|nr:hypothetical protein O9G_004749 [Rozella allomycis CSF55]RKP21210.1 hypothetical protein ROZALSC1DRAFT_27359 [Rozella allomycis CSF55]RKP21216.1 hypothetical protein ROZALSC1DRAFT_27362 [Rozella allomycis CSF55]|eukprot:EPZ36321.1 hypothetical protein O9G_004749 [Rozella allomycis CSF55]
MRIMRHTFAIIDSDLALLKLNETNTNRVNILYNWEDYFVPGKRSLAFDIPSSIVFVSQKLYRIAKQSKRSYLLDVDLNYRLNHELNGIGMMDPNFLKINEIMFIKQRKNSEPQKILRRRNWHDNSTRTERETNTRRCSA